MPEGRCEVVAPENYMLDKGGLCVCVDTHTGHPAFCFAM